VGDIFISPGRKFVSREMTTPQNHIVFMEMFPKEASSLGRRHLQEGNFLPREDVPLRMFIFGETVTSRNANFFVKDRFLSKAYLSGETSLLKKGNFVPGGKCHHGKTSPQGGHSR
jgi:hypothetical protein